MVSPQLLREKMYELKEEDLEGICKNWQNKLHPDLVHSKSENVSVEISDTNQEFLVRFIMVLYKVSLSELEC
jgi:hypothetical protein